MLMPKKTKYRKVQRGRLKGQAKRGAAQVLFGDYGLASVDPGWITARQLESMRVTMSRKLKKVGEMFLRIFPNKPISKKPAETRMGKGKGNPEFWVCVIKRGRMLCEVKGVEKEQAKKIFKAASHKLPIKTRFVERSEGQSV